MDIVNHINEAVVVSDVVLPHCCLIKSIILLMPIALAKILAFFLKSAAGFLLFFDWQSSNLP